MPYKSEAQRKFFNSPAGKRKIGKAEVEEWNKESKGQKNLPEKVEDKLQFAITKIDKEYYFDSNQLLVEIRQRLVEEYEAINNYLSMLPRVKEGWVVDIIKDIADEEKVHVGELEDILYKLNPEEFRKVKEGMKENA